MCSVWGFGGPGALDLFVIIAVEKDSLCGYLNSFCQPPHLPVHSGAQDIQELELGLQAAGIPELLDFLEYSFHGGTEVDDALWRCLGRLESEEWRLADILIVTDGQIGESSPDLLTRLATVRDDWGLRTHGVVIGKSVPETMKRLCTQTLLCRIQ